MRYAPAPFRLLRTTLVAATILGLASGAHVSAGGMLPAPFIMAALMALHVLCSTVATKVRLGFPAMFALLATSQLVLHQGFATLSVAVPMVAMPSAMPSGMHDHSQSAQAVAALQSVALAPAGSAGSMDLMNHSMDFSGSVLAGSLMSGWMMPAHVVATVVTAVLLAQGENALWALANWLRPLCRTSAAVLLLPARQARAAVPPLPLPRLPWRNIRPDTRRGPPPLTAVFA